MPPSEKWGSKVIDSIANEINNKYPTLKGFDRRGLYRMMQLYETYKDNEIVSTLLSQISWSNNIAILSGTKTMKENMNLLEAKITIFKNIVL